MKIYQHLAVLGFVSILFPSVSMAATIEVYPTFGGDGNAPVKFAKDITVCIQYNGTQDCQTGIPTFTIPDGSNYKVVFASPQGYSYTYDSKCAGIAVEGIVCDVDYENGKPMPGHSSQLLPIKGSDIAAAQPQVSSAAPQIAATPATTSIPVTIPVDVTVSTTSSEAAQIAALEAQITQLYQLLISLLAQKLATLKS